MRELDLGGGTTAIATGASRERGAVFLPGRAMGTEWGPMRLAAILLASRGWTTMQLRWRAEGRPEWVEEQARRALDRLAVERPLLVGKSLSTFAAAVAAERGLPGIWFTPLLTDGRVAAALERATAPALLVGGTHDELWDAELAERLPVESLTVVGADHSLEVGDAWETLELQRRVLERVDAFVRGLP
jgi:pimeloyl-ACP methyl ester carboxylesterase